MTASTLAGFLEAAHTEDEAASMREIYERSQHEEVTVSIDYSPKVDPRLDAAAFAVD